MIRLIYLCMLIEYRSWGHILPQKLGDRGSILVENYFVIGWVLEKSTPEFQNWQEAGITFASQRNKQFTVAIFLK